MAIDRPPSAVARPAATADGRAQRRRAATPGDLLLHPAAVLSVGVLVVNDRWLKPHLGPELGLGVVTGKLSDAAGLAFFPLLMASLLELVRWAARGMGAVAWTVTRQELTGVVALTGVGFVAVQVLPAAGDAYAWGLGALRWLPVATAAVLTAAPLPPMPEINHVMDASDTLCVPALWLSYDLGRRFRGGDERDRPGPRRR